MQKTHAILMVVHYAFFCISAGIVLNCYDKCLCVFKSSEVYSKKEILCFHLAFLSSISRTTTINI